MRKKAFSVLLSQGTAEDFTHVREMLEKQKDSLSSEVRQDVERLLHYTSPNTAPTSEYFMLPSSVEWNPRPKKDEKKGGNNVPPRRELKVKK